MREVISSRTLVIRIVSALVILFILLWLFSTSLFLPIRVYDEIYVGNIIVTLIALAFVVKVERLASPLSNEISLKFRLSSQKVGASLKWGLRLVSLAILYVALQGIFFKLLRTYFEQDVLSIIYNAVFVVVGSNIVYQVIKALTS